MDNEMKNKENISENAIPEKNSELNEKNTSKNAISTEISDTNKEPVPKNTVPSEKAGEENIVKHDKKPDSLESILRRFKRQSSGIVAEIKKREAYEKPSVKRKKKSEQARRKKGKFGYNKW